MRLIKKIVSIIERVAKRLLGLVELALFLRLALRFLNANPNTIVVNCIYSLTDNLILPFEFIFQNIYWDKRVIETATISAMIGYIILVFVILRLLHIFSRD